MKTIFFAALLAVCFTFAVSAQPRPVDQGPSPVPANAPSSYEARYEGGVFGASDKEKGTLKFDDKNEQIVFYRKDNQREMFSIPYADLLTIFPDTKVGQSTTGKVLSSTPVPGAGLFGLMNKNTRYVNLTFDDPELNTKGTASFKFEDKEMLRTFIIKLGTTAKMKQRGDAFYRARTTSPF